MSLFKEISERWSSKKAGNGGKQAHLERQEFFKALAGVAIPGQSQSPVDLELIKDVVLSAKSVLIKIQLTGNLVALQEVIRRKCERVLVPLTGSRDLTFEFLNAKEPQASKPKTQTDSKPKTSNRGLSHVANILAIAAGKGGVGKSTTAVNLARSLAKMGAKVGVLDADIYGPSLARLTGVSTPTEMDGSLIVPPEVDGIKMISVSMFSGEEKAQILRGPMAANLVKQFLNQVSWGKLDYLLIDYPPGTGDIQLSISQEIELRAALIVTTPQEIALADVKKSISMFETLHVPILGVVENMSYFLCDGCDKKHYLFKKDGGRNLAKDLGVPFLGGVPIEPQITEFSDSGGSILKLAPGSRASQAYEQLAQASVAEFSRMREQSDETLGSFTLQWT